MPQEAVLHRYGTVIMQRKYQVLSIAAFVGFMTALYALLSTPVYESTARVLIDTEPRSASTGFFDFRGMVGGNKITNQLEHLRSYSLAQSVARALIRRALLDFAQGAPLTIVETARRQSADSTALTAALTQALMRSMDFVPTRESDIIKIIARSSRPGEAALLANTFAEQLAARDLFAARAKFEGIREFLESQVIAERRALDSSEAALKLYMQRSHMVTLDAEAKRVTEQLSDLEAKRDAIEVERTTRLNTLNSYRNQLEVQEPNVARSIEQSNDAYVRLLQDQLATLEVQRDIMVAQNPELAGQRIYNKKLAELDAQIAALKEKLQARTKEFLATVLPSDGGGPAREGSVGYLAQVKQKIIEQQIDLDALDARQAALGRVIRSYEDQFKKIPGKNIGLAQLQRTALGNEKLYLLLRDKYNEAAISERSEFGIVSILDAAIVPTSPVGASPVENLILGLMIGLLLGIAVVLLRADLHTSIRDQEDVRSRGYRLLSTIGCIRGVPEDSEEEEEGPGKKPLDATLVAHHLPLSPLAESYRYLQNAILLGRNGGRIRTIVFTSPNPQEGKTTTVSNLAFIFAESGLRVLVVDADLRRPAIHALFACEKGPGLTDLLQNKLPFRDVVRKDVVDRLDIVCGGSTCPVPSSLLNRRSAQEFLAQVPQAYDLVLIDSSPLNAVNDAAMLIALADAAVIVVSAGSTKVSSLERALESLSSTDKVLGIVLNRYDLRRAYRDTDAGEGYGYYAYAYTGQSHREHRNRHRAKSNRPAQSDP